MEEGESRREGHGGDGAAEQEEDSVVDVHSVKRGRLVVLYCPVHKAASTFWLRVFRFLHHDTPPHLDLDRPDELRKFQVHMSPFKSSRAYALAYLTRTLIQAGDEEFRFMISRDPYQRLWSVYIDKFVLPDHYFWSHHGQAIRQMKSLITAMQTERKEKVWQNSTERSGQEGLRSKTRSGQGRDEPSHECPGDVSFEDLVRYVVQDPASPTAQRDDHLLPVTSLCDPCVFQPHFLGRLENMTEDSRIILDRMGLGQQYAGLDPRADFSSRALSQIKTATEFAQDSLRASLGLRHCVSDVELQDRLLRAFVMYGYLPLEAFGVPRVRVLTQGRQVREMMTRLFLHYNRSQEEAQAQRSSFYVTAYAALPRELLIRLRDYYAEDFEAFGYESQPPQFFSTRK